MTQQHKIEYVKNAPNMIEIEGVLNSVTEDYLTKYANEVEKAPASDNYGTQSKWIEKAVRFHIASIHTDKLAIFNAIPARFYKTAIYQRLSVSQFVKGC